MIAMVVAFLRIRHADDRPPARLEPNRLVIEHPIGHIAIALLREDIGRFPCLGQSGAEPAARPGARRIADDFRGLADIFALVRHVLHVDLGEAMPDEFPFALDGSLHDLRIGSESAAVDVHHARNFELVVYF